MPAAAPKPIVNLPPPDAVVARHPALELLDEAFHRLRLAPASLLGVYYLGTLPFVLALLYFWADQSRSADAADRSPGSTGLLALLFVAMKTAQAVFAARLSARVRGLPAPTWAGGRLGRLVLVQGTLQPPGLFVLGLPFLLPTLLLDSQSSGGFTAFVILLSLLLSLPCGWIYAFYQNVTVLGDGTGAGTGPVLRRALRGAFHRPRQNHAGLSLLTFLGLFAFLNLAVVIVGGPYLLKMFTGEENLFTRSGVHLLNTTFFMVLFGLVYLALDPLAKAFYVLRCFYEDSRRTGEDLLSELAALPRLSPAAVALLLGTVLSLALPGRPLLAAEAAPAPPAARAAPARDPAGGQAVSPPELGRSIEEVLQRRRFAWRAPRAEEKTVAQTGPLDGFFKKIGGWLEAGGRTVGRWFHAVGEWIRQWWQPRERPPVIRPPASAPFLGASLQPLMIGLAVVVAGLLAYLGWRRWQGRKAPVAVGKPVADGAVPVPDLTDDTVLATQLPEDEWLHLARGLLARGERRLALRAFYLSALSSLATRGLLAVARHKSNRDYLQELRRRARLEPAQQAAFGRNVARFERVWYGEHPADDALLAEFQADRQSLGEAAGGVPGGTSPRV